MSQPALLKVYGNLWPARESLYEKIESVCRSAIGAGDDFPVAALEGDMIKISFEGIYFPIGETLDIIRESLEPGQKGKLDVLDLEGWRLTRHIFENGEISSRAASLNSALDYSGY